MFNKPARTARSANRPLRAFLAGVAPVAAVLAAGPLHMADAQGLPAARPQAVGLDSVALARITPALQAYVNSGKFSGIVAVVARRGKVAYSSAVGKMDVERSTPMRTDAVFRIFSMTKPVVAVAILQLVDQGKLRLSDPVSRYIPGFAGMKVYAGGPAASPRLRAPATPVTIEHLLTHTSGLVYGFQPGAADSLYARANLMDPTRTLAQFSDSIVRLPLVFSPGDAWSYGPSIDVLGRVVEVVSGRTLDRQLEEALFRPLGMRETAFHVQPRMNGRIPVLYSRGADGGLVPNAQLLAPDFLPSGRFLSGGAGLLSTPADYMRFAQMLLNKGELDGTRVLSRRSVELMMSNHLPPALTPLPSPSIVGHAGYGHGLGGAVLVDEVLDPLPGSAGIFRWWGYMGTFFWIDPKTETVAMVWTQFENGRPFPLEEDFQRLVYAAVR